MDTSMSIRELTLSGKSLTKYDYIDIEDKKSHEYKGVFVSKKYADEVKRFLECKLKKEKEERLSQLMSFAGIATGDTHNNSAQEIKSKKVEKYK